MGIPGCRRRRAAKGSTCPTVRNLSRFNIRLFSCWGCVGFSYATYCFQVLGRPVFHNSQGVPHREMLNTCRIHVNHVF